MTESTRTAPAARREIILAALALAVLALALTLAAIGTASAGTPVVGTQSVTRTLVSPWCVHRHSVTITNMHWSSKADHYINYPRPSRTVSDSTSCHAH